MTPCEYNNRVPICSGTCLVPSIRANSIKRGELCYLQARVLPCSYIPLCLLYSFALEFIQTEAGQVFVFSCSCWLSLSSQLATLLINLIHLWQQAIFSYLVDEHVMWNSQKPPWSQNSLCLSLPFSVQGLPLCQRRQLDCSNMICRSQSHAGYYPSLWALPCACKLIRHLDLVANVLFVIV